MHEEIPRVELFWRLNDAASGLVGTGLAAAKMIAVYGLDANGAVVRDGGPDWLDDVRVFEDGDPPKLLRPTDGERYLRALPDAFSGIGGSATFINQPAARIDGRQTS